MKAVLKKVHVGGYKHCRLACPTPLQIVRLARATSGIDSTFAPSMSAPDKTAPEVGTVVVSCSALILESKQIVNDPDMHNKLDSTFRLPSFVVPHPDLLGLALQAPGCTTALLSAQSPTEGCGAAGSAGRSGRFRGVPTHRLDALYAKHKGKQITPQQALEQLTTLVGQTTVEQAGLVLSNIQTGTLPAGCAAVALPLTPLTPPYALVLLLHPSHPLHPRVKGGLSTLTRRGIYRPAAWWSSVPPGSA